MAHPVEYFEDDQGFHRWRVRSLNGEIIASSSESFSSKQGAERNYGLVADLEPEPDNEEE